VSLQDILKKYKDVINTETPEYWYPFSLLSLNRLVGNLKGLRGGRMYQFIGEKSTGKSTLSLDLIANAQRYGKVCAYVDFERTFDKEYAQKLGVDLDNLIIVKTDTAEQSLTIVEELIKAGVLLIVLDSIPAAVPSSESDKDYSDNEKMASAAGFITRFCKRIIPILDNYGAIVIVINQNRANFSTLSRKETKPFGPKQLQYSVSLTLELARIKNGDDETRVQALVEKSKIGVERQRAEFTMIYGSGINKEEDLLTLALEYDIIQKTGSWFKYGELKAQGMENAITTFPLDEIRERVLHALE
jgi:recombination protein RecA